LETLINAFSSSDIAASLRAEINALSQHGGANGTLSGITDVAEGLGGWKQATWSTQFRILSGRAFKNIYRDPALLGAHYISAVVVALICAYLYYQVSNSIEGFQNRLGLFFFALALFGFSCLSSLGLFANERLLFMRERANGYYSTFTYFSSKVLFDIVPLRVVPPLVFGGIVYGLVGLVPEVSAFWKFLLALVLFNLSTAGVVMLLSVACPNTGVASLVGTLVMLANLLFTGLLINAQSVHWAFRWLFTASFFHAAFEALAVNELRYLTITDHKYGVDIELPAATVLSLFGLRAESFWFPNIVLLAFFFLAFTTASFFVLHYYVREKR